MPDRDLDPDEHLRNADFFGDHIDVVIDAIHEGDLERPGAIEHYRG